MDKSVAKLFASGNKKVRGNPVEQLRETLFILDTNYKLLSDINETAEAMSSQFEALPDYKPDNYLTTMLSIMDDHLTELGVQGAYSLMIVKVCKPSQCNIPNPLVLIKSEDGSIVFTVEYDSYLESFFAEGEVKAYVLARVWPDSVIQLYRKTTEQGW